MNVEAFRTALGERWKELSAGILSQDNFERRLDHYAKKFRASGAWQREYDKWNLNPVPLDLDSDWTMSRNGTPPTTSDWTVSLK